MRVIRTLSLCMLAAFLAVMTAPASAQSIDGYWVIKITPDSSSVSKGAYAFTEQMLIEGSDVTAEVFSKYGFSPKTVTVISSSPFVFETIMTADKFGSLKWRVTVQSSTRTTGTLSWTRQDGVVWNYTFEANKGTPPAPNGN